VIGGLVLAAGAGERFGGRKQLAELEGRPLLEHVLSAMAASPVDRMVVVLGAHADEVREQVPLHGAEPVVCEAWEQGIGTSVAAGVEALAECEAIVIAVGDQPRLAPEAVARVLEARAGDALAVRALYGCVPGHPVVIERGLFGRLRELHGDEGARVFLGDIPVREVACDGLGAPDDVDTPEALRRVAE